MDLFRPLDDATINDPQPMYHRLRSAEPVHWYAPLSAWVVSGYDDCLFALHRTDLFSSDWRRPVPRSPTTCSASRLWTRRSTVPYTAC
ncbi:hypothetical protein [Streptomyces sp. NBRC 110035]|uniref:hypothetical protein n=1 Tax=Streptomyces sp. NBRC 110035 TaxID=1547867 RepID=UPI0005A7EEFF|nr:hypothetical protein [Streptomyces sp. NBRC 110035]